jgi:ATP-dependent DNA helicase RecQ
VERVPDGYAATGYDWSYDAELYDGVRAARRGEADIMRGYTHGRGCLEAYLRTALDDDLPEGYRCGRCSVCTGSLPGGLAPQPPDEGVRAAKAYLRGIDTVVEPRKMWAPGMTRGRGRIGAALSVDVGRAVAFADDPAWPELDALLAEGAPDVDPPPWLREALVAVLTRWRGDWGERPVAVVPMPSRRRPRLVQGMATHVAEVGHLPLVEALVAEGPAPAHDLAASARAVQVERSLALRPGVALPDAPVLLVDDALRSGWTMTVAGALLREAGVSGVLPLVALRRP